VRLVAHTLATPELELPSALRLFAQLGFDGVEIVQDDGYACGLPTRPKPSQVAEITQILEDLELQAVHITPYVRTLDSLDDNVRTAALTDMIAAIDLATRLGAVGVRVLAGRAEGDGLAERQEAFLASMRALADVAEGADVSLNIESKGWSFAARSADLIAHLERITSPAVGVLLDPANLQLDGFDPVEELVGQAPFVRHVHVKDLHTRSPGEFEVVPLGEGHVPWPALLAHLAATGYDGGFSFEYERRWHPTLPPAAASLPRETAAFRRLTDNKGAMET